MYKIISVGTYVYGDFQVDYRRWLYDEMMKGII